MKKHSYIILLIALISCCGKQTEIKYAFSDIEITRIDECGKTTFYYSKNQNKIPGKIWAEYSGINDGFSGYLKFDENGKVTLLSGDGYFQQKGLDTALFEYQRIIASERPELTEGVCEILYSTRYEQERNNGFKSGIQFTYKIDENEGW